MHPSIHNPNLGGLLTYINPRHAVPTVYSLSGLTYIPGADGNLYPIYYYSDGPAVPAEWHSQPLVSHLTEPQHSNREPGSSGADRYQGPESVTQGEREEVSW